MLTGHLVSGHTRSCGCINTELVTKRNFKHGKSQSKLHGVWAGMKQRCYYPKHISWPSHGAKGVKVCARWHEFKAFSEDMGERPAPGMSIDRIDTGGHYSCGACEECRENGWPRNVRWADKRTQTLNRALSLLLTHDGQTLHLIEWAERSGIPYRMLYDRIGRGWDAQRALTTPPGAHGRGPIKSLWRTMLHRCHNPRNAKYPTYGGIGITVCTRWRSSLDAFKADMGERPPGLSVDRIDNEKGYWCGKAECPECGPLGRESNCRWADAKTQAKNRRTRRRKLVKK